MPATALGIPDRSNYGDTQQLTAGQLVDYVVQQHNARVAGPHQDIRLGTPETDLFSWASRKGIPGIGEKHLAVQQPLHSHGYKDFEGEIPEGYGAGSVSIAQQGKALVTKVTPDAIHFTTGSKKQQERFVLLKTKGTHWLMVNTTPTQVLPYNKIRFKSVPAEQAESTLKNLKPGSTAQAKLDGAANLLTFTKHGPEIYSYRASATGLPIVHTEKVFKGRPEIKIPKELIGTILRGELYGKRTGVLGPHDTPGGVIPPQELGGLLNATLENSLAKQQQSSTNIHNMLFDIQRMGNQPVTDTTPYKQRLAMVSQLLKYLPADQFHMPEQATTPEQALALYNSIANSQHPLTTEGVVVHHPTGRPDKIKLTDDFDVHVTGTFPGEGKYKNSVGGLEYSLKPGGPTVGRVGTGFDDATRRALASDPSVIGRVARIKSMQQLPSGAYRQPSFIAFHEDYPLAKGLKTE